MPRKVNPDDDRVDEAVNLIRSNGWCTFQYIRERLVITGSVRGLWKQLCRDPRVFRTQKGSQRVWAAR